MPAVGNVADAVVEDVSLVSLPAVDGVTLEKVGGVVAVVERGPKRGVYGGTCS